MPRPSPPRSGVTVANDNAPGQVVLSGSASSSTSPRSAAARERRARAPLDVAGAFHSPQHGSPPPTAFRAALDETRCTRPPSPSSPAPSPRRSPTFAPSSPRTPQAGALAGDGARAARRRRRALRRGRSRQRARPPGQAHPRPTSPSRPRSLPMRSAELPADLATIAREATRNGSTEPAAARTACVIGLGHHVPPEIVPNADRRAHRRRRRLDRQAHRHQVAPPRAPASG